jgi:hypothetical protein
LPNLRVDGINDVGDDGFVSQKMLTKPLSSNMFTQSRRSNVVNMTLAGHC